MTVPVFTLTGNVGLLMGASQMPSAGMTLVLRPNVRASDLLAIDGIADFVSVVKVLLDSSGKINGGNGQKLLANDDSLGLTNPVQWSVSLLDAAGAPTVSAWTFDAPTAGTTMDILDALPVVGVTAVGTTRGPQGPPGTTTWAGITDKFTIEGQTPAGGADVKVVAPATHTAASKTLPVDADEIPISDSAASFSLKKLTWANLKAAISSIGNAATATKLATARNINGVAFDGTANITITDATAEKLANKNVASGYAGLDSGGKVAAAQLPSYVDDVLEYANLAAFPSTGQQTGIIYVADDTGKAYRWSGSSYIEISPSPGSTDSVSEGSVNLYYTNARADARVAAAITNNADGTLSVTGVNSLEPLSTVTILATSTAPAIGQTTYYNANSGNLTPTLPALSGLRVGARLAVRRDPADVSQNTVTLTCAGSDTFYSSGATTTTLPLSGEQREYQVISQSGTKYWVPAGSLNPVSALDKRYLHAWPFPMARNTIAVIGDSISALGTGDWYQPWLGHTWINQLIVMSHQRIRYGAGNFSVAGTTISQQQATQLPQVLAMNPLPGACVLALSTNDLAGAGFVLATEAAALKAMIAALEAVGVVPILWCPPPDNHTGGAIAVSAVHANMYLWNTWVRRFAAANGYALVDANTALALQDGTAISGSIDSSGVHPSGYGARLIAEQALADGVDAIFPPNSLANTARTTDDLTNMFGSGTLNRGLFTTDANSDGVADGLSKGTSGTASLEAGQANEQIAGRWQRFDVPATQTGNLTAVFTTGWSVGDTIAFSYRLKTQNIETNLGWHMAALKTDTPGGFITPDGTSETYLWNGPVQWDCDVDDGEVYVEFVIPAAATDLQLWISLFGGAAGAGCTLWVAEVTVRNLTTQGLLV